jgi:aldehyde oxidoreductase
MLNKDLIINGNLVTVFCQPEASLASVLREQLHLTGTKIGCGEGLCGACSIIMDGKLIRSCVMKMRRVPDQAKIETIEGIGTPDHLHPLQMAWMTHGGAQCGYCTPGFIVSAKALLDENQAPSRQDVRDWFQKNRNACRCTGYKQLVDAVMEAAQVVRGEKPIEDLEFKMPEDGRIWNTKYPRPTALAKVTGTCDYGADLGIKLPPDTLHLALAQAKVSHARIISIDTSEAEQMPGVYRVLTHKDVKGKNRIFGFVLFPWSKADGYDRPILCDDKIFQYGDAYAVVCADSEENARAAADKVKLEYEALPAYMNALEAAADDAMEIHPGTPNVYFEMPLIKGEDTAPIMESAEYVAEDDFYVQRQPHMPIEPDVGFAYIDEEGRVTIHTKSISLFAHHIMIRDGLGLPADKLRIVQNPMGGSFGYKLSPTNEALLAVATMATGRPCILRYNYEQQMTYTGKRSPAYFNLKMAANKEGKIVAM